MRKIKTIFNRIFDNPRDLRLNLKPQTDQTGPHMARKIYKYFLCFLNSLFGLWVDVFIYFGF